MGRSRHECTHFAYIVPMIVSEVGRTTRRSSSTSLPPCVTQATCVAIGKVRAKVAAAALLPPQRGARDQQTHGDDAAEAPELAIDNARGGRGSKQRMPCVEPRDGRVDAMPLAQQTAVPPHQRPDIVC